MQILHYATVEQQDSTKPYNIY